MNKKQNQRERDEFIKRWAAYVRTHSDQEWSKQQNVIINSALASSTLTREQYLKLKGERCLA